MAGAYCGVNRAECSPGSGKPVLRLSASFAGYAAPSQYITAGIFPSSENSPTSSLPITGRASSTRCGPSAAAATARTCSVRPASFSVGGVLSPSVTTGMRSAGMP